MKTITKFKADDGREFDDEETCRAHDALLAEIEIAMREWPKSPENDGCSFANGGGFLKIPLRVFYESREALLDIAIKHCNHEGWAEQVKAGTRHGSHLGRLFDDSNSPLYGPWLRILNTDKELREWGQGYYAVNPGTGDQVCLNP